MKWLDMTIPAERLLTLETHRRTAARLHPDELIAVHDSLLVGYCHLDHMLRQAMLRIAELEAKEAAGGCQ